MKHCPDCDTVKPSSEFYAHPRSPDGLQRRCKVCDNARRARHAPPGRERVPVCSLCCNLSHRVPGPKCSLCGRRYADEQPAEAETYRSSPIAAFEELA